MELISLGQGDAACMVLRYRGSNILLDCALCHESVLLAIPPPRLDASDPAASRSNASLLTPEDDALEGVSRSPPVRMLGPLLQMARLYDIHAVLVSTPEGLLGLPLLARLLSDPEEVDNEDDLTGRDAVGQTSSGAGDRTGRPLSGAGAISRSRWRKRWRPSIFATPAALDVARHLAAEIGAAVKGDSATLPVQLGPQAGQNGGEGGREGGGRGRGRYPDPAVVGWQLPEDATGATRRAYEACWQGQRPEEEGSHREGVEGGGRERRRDPPSLLAFSKEAEMESFFDRVQVVRYGQHVSLDDTVLGAVPYPSGSGIGHCVWVVADETHRIGYASRLCLEPGRSLSTELEPATLAALSALILGPGCCTYGPPLSPSTSSPIPPCKDGGMMPTLDLAKACQEVVDTLRNKGGSVLLPVSATGDAWPLIESLAGALARSSSPPTGPPARAGPSIGREKGQGPNSGGNSGLGIGGLGPSHGPSVSPPSPLMCIVGPAARNSLALACTAPEFLARSRQAGVYKAEMPFLFDTLLASGQILAATSLTDPKLRAVWKDNESCLVVVPIQSLLSNAGPGRELIKRWGKDERNLMLLGLSSSSGAAASGPSPRDVLRAALGVAAEGVRGRGTGEEQPGRADEARRGEREGGGGVGMTRMRTRVIHLSAPRPSSEDLGKFIGYARPKYVLLAVTTGNGILSLPSFSNLSLRPSSVLSYSWLRPLSLSLSPHPALPLVSLPPHTLVPSSLGQPQQLQGKGNAGLQWKGFHDGRVFAAEFEGKLKFRENTWRLEASSPHHRPDPVGTSKPILSGLVPAISPLTASTARGPPATQQQMAAKLQETLEAKGMRCTVSETSHSGPEEFTMRFTSIRLLGGMEEGGGERERGREGEILLRDAGAEVIARDAQTRSLLYEALLKVL